MASSTKTDLGSEAGFIDPDELELDYRRALDEHYAEGRRGVRSFASTALFLGMVAIVAVLPVWGPAQRLLGVGLEWTVPIGILSGASIVHAAIAFHRGGALSRWYFLAEDLESLCSVVSGLLLVWASGSATSVFWIYFVFFVADSWNVPHRTIAPLVLSGIGTASLALAFARRGAITDAAVTACLGVLMVMTIHAFASSARHRVRAEAERRILRRRLERLLVERERDRIARELHDGVAADLSTLLFRARELKRSIGDGEISALVDGLVADARRSLDELREIVFAQEKSSGTWEGFVEELRRRVERLCADGMSSEVMVRDLPGCIEVPPGVRAQVLRIVQEGVRNAVRHANARTVRVVLERGKELSVNVVDDGDGVPDEALAAPGRGIRNITKRARDLGGEAVWSRDHGTRLAVRLPLVDEVLLERAVS